MKSELEKAYKAIALRFNVDRKWEELHPQEQHNFVMAMNTLFSILGNTQRF